MGFVMRTQAEIDGIGHAIVAAMPELDATDRSIALAVYRLMAGGSAVEPAAIARASGAPAERVESRLSTWPDVYRDGRGRVVGFWGHAISKLDPEYRLLVDGVATYAWCAVDTLFIPPLLGKTVRAESADPVTGEPVSLVVDVDRVRDLRPASAVVSMVVPHDPFDHDVIESFCHRVLFFASTASGGGWTARHPGTTLVTVAEAFEIGRSLTRRILR